MYDHLLGEIVEKHASRAVVRCHGVGYDVRISLHSATSLEIGSTRQLFTILHVVDGVPSLLGFTTASERELARRLLNVTNVGPSIALALLGVYTPHELAQAIVRGDAAALRAVKGVGQKTAERLCLELRDVVTKIDLGAHPATGKVAQTLATDDAVAALVTLGYAERDARDKVEKVRRRADAPAADDTEALVKAVLQM
jgi:holliday junction DNA helicase RuvA